VYDVSLHAWTIHGCEAFKLIPEAVEVIGEGKVLLPNVFSPFDTGPTDGWYNPSEHLNRIFYPVDEGVVEYKLEICNRWGERLFHTTEINRGWDGYYQDVLCAQGVYVWQVWVVYANGRTENLAGDVTLRYKTE
jgi:hypothetical protein